MFTMINEFPCISLFDEDCAGICDCHFCQLKNLFTSSRKATTAIGIGTVKKLGLGSMNLRDDQDNIEQDAQEFMNRFCFSMDSYAVKSYGLTINEGAPTREIFGFTTVQSMECSKCHKQFKDDDSEEYGDILMLSIPNKVKEDLDLEPLIEDYLHGEDIKYKCKINTCTGKTHLSKKLITRLPSVLVIMIKRFGIGTTKVNTIVHLPDDLCLEGFCDQTELQVQGSHTYKLEAMILHHGNSIISGHYTAIIKNSRNETWEYNDRQTTFLERNVSSYVEGRGSVYLAFYQRMTEEEEAESKQKNRSNNSSHDIVAMDRKDLAEDTTNNKSETEDSTPANNDDIQQIAVKSPKLTIRTGKPLHPMNLRDRQKRGVDDGNGNNPKKLKVSDDNEEEAETTKAKEMERLIVSYIAWLNAKEKMEETEEDLRIAIEGVGGRSEALDLMLTEALAKQK